MITETNAHYNNIYQAENSQILDRYSDIRTFDHSRVKLDMKQSPNNDTDYINAGFIDVSFLFLK